MDSILLRQSGQVALPLLTCAFMIHPDHRKILLEKVFASNLKAARAGVRMRDLTKKGERGYSQEDSNRNCEIATEGPAGASKEAITTFETLCLKVLRYLHEVGEDWVNSLKITDLKAESNFHSTHY